MTRESTALGAAYYFGLDGTALQATTATYYLDSGYGAFGTSVDIFGDVVLVGVPDTSLFTTGTAYLIDTTESGTGWQTNGLLTSTDTTVWCDLGYSVALGERGSVIAGPHYNGANDEAALCFFPHNRTPAAKNMELVVANPSGTSQVCGSVVATDAFEQDWLTYSVATQPGAGTVTIMPTGEIIYTPTSSYPVWDTFTYTATDPYGAEDTAEVTIYFDSAQILNRGIFYNGCFNDARDVSREGNAESGGR